MRRNVLYCHFLFSNDVSNVVVLGINVFGSTMVFGVFSKRNCCLIVTVNCDRFNTITSNTQISKNLLNQIASCTAVEHAINSASIVDKAMQVCYLLHQDMAPLLSKKT